MLTGGKANERQKGTQLIVLLYTVILLCREAKGDIVLIDKSRMSPFAILSDFDDSEGFRRAIALGVLPTREGKRGRSSLFSFTR